MKKDKDTDLAELVGNAQQGDRAAFECLIARTRDDLKATIGARIGNHLRGSVEIEDILQETYTRALQAIGNFAKTTLRTALRELEKIRATVPHQSETDYYLIKGHLMLLDKDAARKVASRALDSSHEFFPVEVLARELLELEPDAPGGRTDRLEWEDAWLDAHEAVRERHWQQAVSAYTHLLKLSEIGGAPYIGSSIDFRIGNALARLKTGDPDDQVLALIDFARVWGECSRCVEPALFVGKTLHDMGDTRTAEKIFEDLYAANSNETRIEIAKFATAMYSSRPDGAKLVTGMYNSVAGGSERALLWARRVGEGHVVLRRSFSLRNAGRFSEAAVGFREILDSAPTDFWALCGLGYCLENLIEGRAGPERAHELDEFLRVATIGIRAYPQELVFYALLAWAQVEFGEIEEAVEAAEKSWYLARAANRGGSHALRCLSWVHLAQGNLERAELYQREALELYSESPLLLVRLAEILQRRGQLIEASRLAEEAIAKTPPTADVHGRVAGIFIRQGKLRRAVELCKKAAKLPPKNSSVAENHAEALLGLGRTEDALFVANAGIESTPDRPRLHLVRALILDEVGLREDARRALEQALSLKSDFPEASAKLEDIVRDR